MAAACGNSTEKDHKPTNKEITIAVMQGITGPLKSTSEDFILGVNAAVDEINAKGGIGGRKIKVNLLDTQSDPTHAVSVLNGVLNSDNRPDVVVPGGTSSEVLALLPALTEDKIFSVSPASSPAINDPAKNPYHFGVSPTQNDMLQIITESLKSHQAKTLGALVGSDALGDAALRGVQQAAQSMGVKVVAVERPSPTGLDYTVNFQRLVAAKPDIIFADFLAADAVGRMFTARRTVGAQNIQLIGGLGASSAVPARNSSGPAIDNCEMPSFNFAVATAPEPAYLGSLATAITKGNNPQRSAFGPGLGYDTIKIAAFALEGANGDTSGKALAKAMTDRDVPKDYSALFPAGTKYTTDNHFPTLTTGSQAMIPCTSEIKDGFWIVKK
jgi:ABC-type branched-subunit amino acid transport system substrate-binding protein